MAAGAWSEADSQWTWVRHWVERALQLAEAESLDVRLGAGARPETRARLQREYAGRLQVSEDPKLSAGLVVQFGERLLDARLAAHCPHAERVVAAVLDGWIEANRGAADG